MFFKTHLGETRSILALVRSLPHLYMTCFKITHVLELKMSFSDAIEQSARENDVRVGGYESDLIAGGALVMLDG